MSDTSDRSIKQKLSRLIQSMKNRFENPALHSDSTEMQKKSLGQQEKKWRHQERGR